MFGDVPHAMGDPGSPTLGLGSQDFFVELQGSIQPFPSSQESDHFPLSQVSLSPRFLFPSYQGVDPCHSVSDSGGWVYATRPQQLLVHHFTK